MRTIIFCFTVMILASCDSNRVFEQFQTLGGAWSIDNELAFEFSVEDASVSHNLITHFKYDMSFEYHNFYFQSTLLGDEDSILFTQLDEVIFFDRKTGEPLGNGIGGSFDISYPIRSGFQFPKNGTYKIKYQKITKK